MIISDDLNNYQTDEMGVSVGDLFVHRFGELVGDSNTLGVEEAVELWPRDNVLAFDVE